MNKGKMELIYENYKQSGDISTVINGELYFRVVDIKPTDVNKRHGLILTLPYMVFYEIKGNVIQDERGHTFIVNPPIETNFSNGIPEWYQDCGQFLVEGYKDCDDLGHYFRAIGKNKDKGWNCDQIIGKFETYWEGKDELFYLSYGSYFGGACMITIRRRPETGEAYCSISGRNGYPEDAEFGIDINVLNKIHTILEKIKQWNNTYAHPHDIIDGFGWTIRFKDRGKTFEKDGYMAYPENYNEVMQKLLEFLESLKRHMLGNDYKYLPLSPFESQGFFLPIGEEEYKEEYYREIDFKPGIELWHG